MLSCDLTVIHAELDLKCVAKQVATAVLHGCKKNYYV